MTEEEYINLIEATELAVEDYFKVQGFDIDLSSMSMEDIEQFMFAHVARDSETMARFQDYVSAVVYRETSSYETEMMFNPVTMGVEAGFMLLPIPGLSFNPKKLKNVGKWLGGLLKVGSKADSLLAPVAGKASKSRTIREQGFGRVDDVAEAVKAGVKPGRLGGPNFGVPRSSQRIVTAGTSAGADQALTRSQAAFGAVTGGVIAKAGMEAQEGIFPSQSQRGEQEQVALEETVFPNEEGYLKSEDDPEIESPWLTFSNGKASLNSDSNQILKKIYHQTLTDGNIADKIVNYLSGNSVHVLTGGGASLIESLTTLGPTGANKIAGVEVIDLQQGTQGIDLLYDYFIGNPEKNIPNYKAGVSRITGEAKYGTNIQTINDVLTREAIQNVVNSSLYMFVMPDYEGGDPSQINLQGDQVALIESYDGTPFGGVDSLNDLFPNGGLGPMRMKGALSQMSFNEIMLLQQKMLTWGYLEGTPEVWGENLFNKNTGDFPLEIALQKFQADVNAVGMEMYNKYQTESRINGVDIRSYSEFISTDGSPHIDKVLDTALARRLAPTEGEVSTEDSVRSQILGEATNKITEILTGRGFENVPEGIESELHKAISALDPTKQEELFGEGGNVAEQGLIEELLKQFYGAENWASMLRFGNNKDSTLFDYAMFAGALTEDERQKLETGIFNRKHFRAGRASDVMSKDTETYEKDVAVSLLTKFINNYAGDSWTPMDLGRALNDWQNTVNHRNNQFTEIELQNMGANALSSLRERGDEFNYDTTAELLAGGYVDNREYYGRDAWNYRTLAEELNKIGGSSARGLEVGNV